MKVQKSIPHEAENEQEEIVRYKHRYLTREDYVKEKRSQLAGLSLWMRNYWNVRYKPTKDSTAAASRYPYCTKTQKDLFMILTEICRLREILELYDPEYRWYDMYKSPNQYQKVEPK